MKSSQLPIKRPNRTSKVLLQMSDHPTNRELALRKFAGYLPRMIRVTCDTAIYQH